MLKDKIKNFLLSEGFTIIEENESDIIFCNGLGIIKVSLTKFINNE